MCDLLTTMMIDDYVTSDEPRTVTRERVLLAIAGELPVSVGEVKPEQLESLKEAWGRSPEAMAAQENLPDWLE